MNKAIIAPSLLAADFRNLEREFDKINSSEAEWLHFDVMDGHFVPNISFGFPLLEATRSLTTKFIDVHLMIENPSRYFEEFKRCGADGLSIHYEGNENLAENLQEIRKLGMKSGLVINPDTPVSAVESFLPYVDLLLIMSIVPGFGGQKFMESTYEKIIKARRMIQDTKFNILLEVDGGISIHNSRQLIDSGANVLVCGSALFKVENFQSYVLDLNN